MDKQALTYETYRSAGEQLALKGKSTDAAVRGMQRERAKKMLASIGNASAENYKGYGLGPKPAVKKPPSKLVSALGTILGRGYVAAKVLTTGKI